MASLPAFPGAAGWGSTTPGGRGGTVYHVTNTSDSPITGSLRKAVEASGPRTVVFDIPGNIINLSPLKIKNPFLTIAGHSAPGEGITLQGEYVGIQTSDVVMRYLRIRSGDVTPPAGGASWDTRDSIDWDDPDRTGNVGRTILDHCSISWSVDENCTAWGGAHDITVQRCFITEPLLNSSHPKGAHSMSLLAGSGTAGVPTYNISWWGNFIAHGNERNPQIAYCDMVDVRNNVFYNCGDEVCAIEKPGLKRVNLVANAWLKGPNSGNQPTCVRVQSNPPEDAAVGTRMYIAGNYDEYSGLTDPEADNWVLMRDYSGGQLPKSLGGTQFAYDVPFDMPYVRTLPATVCIMCIPKTSGCVKPYRDGIDTRIYNDFLARAGAIINHPSDVGGWETMAAGALPTDTDGDGMPDAWETRYGLNPNDPSDANADRDGDGYTNLEEYHHSLA